MRKHRSKSKFANSVNRNWCLQICIHADWIDILCVNETKIVKIRTQNAKKVLIKDQVLKIRTLLETVQWPVHNLSSSLFYPNAVVQVVAYQPPPGYALVPMAEVNSQYVVIISSIFVKLTFTFSASSYWGSHCTSFIWQGCCLNGKNLKNKKSCTALSEALIRYSHCSIHPNVQNGKLSHCVFSA